MKNEQQSPTENRVPLCVNVNGYSNVIGSVGLIFTIDKAIKLTGISVVRIDSTYTKVRIWRVSNKEIINTSEVGSDNFARFSNILPPGDYMVSFWAPDAEMLGFRAQVSDLKVDSTIDGVRFKVKAGYRTERFSRNKGAYPDQDSVIPGIQLYFIANASPSVTLTANNQPLTENQRIGIGTNDFTINITANDTDPDDTLQFRVKLNNVVKTDWTAIAKNQPVSHMFKNADITAGVNPFTVSVRDDKGNQTDFNGYLDKSWLVEDITSSVEIRRAEVYELGVSRGSIFGSTKSEIRRRSDGSIYLLLSFTHRLSPKEPNGNDFPLYFKRITPYPETYHPEASEIVTTGGNITKIEHTIAGNTIIFSADIPPTLIGKTITNLQYYSKYMDPAQEFFFQADYGGRSAASFTRFALKNNIVIKSSWFNTAPTLNVASPADNQTLTENATLNIQGTASDTDKDNVVTIKYRINNGTTRALQSGVSNGSTPISFAKTLTFRTKRLYDGTTDFTGSDLAENTDHTLTIWAEDDQGGKSTEVTRKFRVVHNRPPVITGQNEDLGVLSAIPSKNYTVTEPEGDAFTITEKINGKIIRTFAGTASKENTATIPLDTWLRLSLTSVHSLTIEATDSKGMTSVRTYTFRRSADKIAFVLGKPFDTDIAAKRILVTIDATVPPGADYKVEVCNNGHDDSPTWEDATNFVKFNRGFIFTNKEKTAEKWGVSLRFTFVKGSATEPVIVRGFGGAFD
ncbi:Ig-like domain-containing protein [Brevibacillus laterosporus]|uniref:Ig-like domain-containing protein n=2 Tax=Brevibacillus laterosporus TaxID=1465 RepID=UPI002E1C30A9|nr:Ig-like domain-containing protein [Brevibacillus laterosporus]MED1669948.1 Ig-like domain-containing protein [Brevibacillus laterosporus]MED1717277.1 Ig-like domain-containing protein [Brevibacillus laterosporus]